MANFSGDSLAMLFGEISPKISTTTVTEAVGYLCFEDLKQAALKKEGASFSLKNFHKKILETGPCPFPVLYKYVLQKS